MFSLFFHVFSRVAISIRGARFVDCVSVSLSVWKPVSVIVCVLRVF